MKSYFSKNLFVLILIALLLPLFYLNVKDSHDWGDDFAQYFIQARNILEERPQTDNGLVFDRQTGEYALQAYPVGFPLILASAWSCFGNSVLVSSLVLSVFFFAFGLVCYFYFKKYFSDVTSILLTLVIIYNPFTIGFKKEILSDVPFSFFLLLGILLFKSSRANAGHYILTGIVWGFALSVRGIGASLLLAALLYFLARIIRYLLKRESRNELRFAFKKLLIVAFAALGFYFLLNSVLFPVPSGGILRFYADAVRDEHIGKWLLLNLDYYYQVFLNFFTTMGGSWQWLSAATKYLLLLFIIPGIIICWTRKMEFEDWHFLAYLMVIFIYPYLGGGFRFLLPVMPVLLKYIFTVFTSLSTLAKIPSSKPLILFLLVILLQYIPGNIDQARSMHVPEQGPQGIPAMETFEYISRLPGDAVVVFLKPRALSFYSGKKAAYVTRNIDPATLRDLFTRMNAHYFLLCHENDEVNDVLLKKFVEDYRQELKPVYTNSYFELYSDLP